MEIWYKRKLGLALGSGAAKGLAHIGVLEVLEEEKIPIHCIAGTSIGALIGGFYAAGLGIKKLKEFAYQTDWKRIALLFAPSLPRGGLVGGKRIENLLHSFLGSRKIEELPIPFACVATDLTSGEEVIIDRGDLVKGVRASISMQGILSPVILNGRILIDGGIINPVPVNILAKMGANFIIASNINPALSKPPVRIKDAQTKEKIEIPNIFTVLLQSASIMQQKITEDSLSGANLVINSPVFQIKLLEFHRAREAVAAGRKAMKQILENWKKGS